MSFKVTEQDVTVVVISAGHLLEIAAALANNPYHEAVLVDESNNFVVLRGAGCLNHNLVVIDSKVTIQYQVEDGEVMTSYPELLDGGDGMSVYCETCDQYAHELTVKDDMIVYKETS